MADVVHHDAETLQGSHAEQGHIARFRKNHLIVGFKPFRAQDRLADVAPDPLWRGRGKQECTIKCLPFEEDLEHALWIRQEVAGDPVMLGLLVGDALDAGGRKLIDERVGIGHQDRRMGGDDELRFFQHQVVDAGDDRKLAFGRERGLGLVQQIEAIAAEAVQHQREEGFAVRLLVQRAVTVGWADRRTAGSGIELLDFGGDVEETFRAEEKTIARSRMSARNPQEAMKFRVGFAGAEPEVLCCLLYTSPSPRD